MFTLFNVYLYSLIVVVFNINNPRVKINVHFYCPRTIKMYIDFYMADSSSSAFLLQ